MKDKYKKNMQIKYNKETKRFELPEIKKIVLQDKTLNVDICPKIFNNIIDFDKNIIIQEFWHHIRLCLTDYEFGLIWLKYKEDKSYTEIANIYDESGYYIKTQINRILLKLQENIDKDYFEALV